MSLFRRVLGLDAPASPDLAVDPHRPIPVAAAGETQSVRVLSARLDALPPARARYLAAFAYLLGRAAQASDGLSDARTRRIVAVRLSRSSRIPMRTMWPHDATRQAAAPEPVPDNI